MSITLPKEIENRLIGSVKKYFEENLDSEIGDLKATLLLDFFLKEIGPTIYNQAIFDAQAVITEKVSDLENSCYQPEFMYWHAPDNK